MLAFRRGRSQDEGASALEEDSSMPGLEITLRYALIVAVLTAVQHALFAF